MSNDPEAAKNELASRYSKRKRAEQASGSGNETMREVPVS